MLLAADTMLVSVYILFPLQGSGPYLLTVGQDFAGLFEAALAALRIRLPLASMYIHVKQLTATEHSNLWFSHLGAWPVHFGHGQSLEREGKGGEEEKEERWRWVDTNIVTNTVFKADPGRLDHSF